MFLIVSLYNKYSQNSRNKSFFVQAQYLIQRLQSFSKHLFWGAIIIHIHVSSFFLFSQGHLTLYSYACLFFGQISCFDHPLNLCFLLTSYHNNGKTDMSQYLGLKQSRSIDKDEFLLCRVVINNLLENLEHDVFAKFTCQLSQEIRMLK